MSAFLLAILLATGCSDPENEVASGPDAAPPSESTRGSDEIESAVELYNRGELEPALAAAERYLIAHPTDATALTLVVQIQNDQGDKLAAAQAAEALAVAMPTDSSKILVRAHYWYIETKQFTDAERVLRAVVADDPMFVEAQRSLAGLLCAQGRRSESVAPLKQLIRLRVAQPNELLALIDVKSPFQVVSYEPYYDKDDGSLFNLGDALKAYAIDNQPDVALKTLETVVAEHPDCAPAIALQGRILIECGRRDDFDQWLLECPPEVADHADYWSAVGLAKQLQSDLPTATAAYAKAITLDPTDRNSLRGLAECFEANRQSEPAQQVRERLVVLERVFRIANEANAKQCEEIATLLQSLTRPLESTGWLMRAMALEGKLPTQQRAFHERMKKITAWESSHPMEARQNHWLTNSVGLKVSDLPIASAGDSSVRSFPANSQNAAVESRVRFVERTAEVGLAVEGPAVVSNDKRHVPFLYQTTGAGVAMFDFDRDGNADFYETRCLTRPLQEDSASSNRLYRQVAPTRFVDAATWAGVGDQGFGQGVTSGDLNQDGFPDLLVANFGTNRLYLNQGDGSFQLADSIEFDPESWTTSVAIADLTGDGLPEIAEVNYIDDPAAPTRPCPLGTSCTPQQMIPAEDYFYLARPDGSFEPIKKSVETQTASYGMGLVVADFSGDGANEVFVGNDAEYNQFWKWNAENGTLVESALARGCAVGRNGNSQACMGIASGDFDQDGQLDLYVTNFLQEPANLFVQTTSGLFSDEALRYGLFEASHSMLGFGTQACDFNHDGHLDLLTLNGHVYGDPSGSVPFRMRPQLFSGRTDGFRVLERDQAGAYFGQVALGRSLAVFDWGHDGDMDIVATHLDRPLAILENVTESNGHWVQIELIGTRSERDAIGARITVSCGERKFHAWRTAGDGYLSRNEAVVHVGLGDEDRIDELTIRWSSGVDQRFAGFKSGKRYRVVEGDDRMEVIW
ncbi:MAG: FG-GAP-like repeat-containing protein [Planctomycetota bacterium]